MKKPENLSVRFGTDGIRGIYGKELTDGTAFAVGNALGRSASGGRVIVGRDTRTSGAPLARALAEGAAAAGSDVCDLGVVTTPCVAFVTRATGARFGVMIVDLATGGRELIGGMRSSTDQAYNMQVFDLTQYVGKEVLVTTGIFYTQDCAEKLPETKQLQYVIESIRFISAADDWKTDACWCISRKRLRLLRPDNLPYFTLPVEW